MMILILSYFHSAYILVLLKFCSSQFMAGKCFPGEQCGPWAYCLSDVLLTYIFIFFFTIFFFSHVALVCSVWINQPVRFTTHPCPARVSWNGQLSVNKLPPILGMQNRNFPIYCMSSSLPKGPVCILRGESERPQP